MDQTVPVGGTEAAGGAVSTVCGRLSPADLNMFICLCMCVRERDRCVCPLHDFLSDCQIVTVSKASVEQRVQHWNPF